MNQPEAYLIKMIDVIYTFSQRQYVTDVLISYMSISVSLARISEMICVVNGLNTLRPRQDGRHFADDIFMGIFFNEDCCILIKLSLKYVRKGPIDNNPALV